MSRLLIRSGRVVDPATGLDAVRDVLIDDDGMLAAIEPSIDPGEAEVIEAEGLVVAPGFVDLRARLREPGLEHAETIESGARAAAAGGFTVVCCLPETQPFNDSATVTSFVVDRAARQSYATVLPIGAVTKGGEGLQLAEIGAMKAAGAVAVGDADRTVMNSALMRRALLYAKSFGLTVISHCEDATLTSGGDIHEGAQSVRLGLRGMPGSAEAIVVARDCILSAETGAPLHLAHLSTAQATEHVRTAKRSGLHVTAEAAAINLALTVEQVDSYDSNYKVLPPLRTSADRDALIAGLLDGTLDAVSSDHAPHTGNVKMQEFESCPFGATGLETAVAIAIEALHHDAGAPITRLVELFTSGPAKALGRRDLGRLFVGLPAALTLLDLERRWTFTPEATVSKSRNSPFYGRSFHGGPAATVVGGRITWSALSSERLSLTEA